MDEIREAYASFEEDMEIPTILDIVHASLEAELNVVSTVQKCP